MASACVLLINSLPVHIHLFSCVFVQIFNKCLWLVIGPIVIYSLGVGALVGLLETDYLHKHNLNTSSVTLKLLSWLFCFRNMSVLIDAPCRCRPNSERTLHSRSGSVCIGETSTAPGTTSMSRVRIPSCTPELSAHTVVSSSQSRTVTCHLQTPFFTHAKFFAIPESDSFREANLCRWTTLYFNCRVAGDAGSTKDETI